MTFALVLLAGVIAFVIGRMVERRRGAPTRAPVAVPSGDPRASIAAHLEMIPYPRPRCSRCRAEITVEREGDLYWLRASQGKFFRYHLGCANAYGEPLP